jgi:hypothetical protein
MGSKSGQPIGEPSWPTGIWDLTALHLFRRMQKFPRLVNQYNYTSHMPTPDENNSHLTETNALRNVVTHYSPQPQDTGSLSKSDP